MCKSPWHTGPHGQVFGLVCYFPKGFGIFYISSWIFWPHPKCQGMHGTPTKYFLSTQILRYNSHRRNKYLLSMMVFPIGTPNISKYSGNNFLFCSRSLCRSMYVHIVFMKFLCGLQCFVPFLCLKPDTKRYKPHGTPSTWPLEDQEFYMSFSLRYFYEILTRSLRDLREIWILQGKVAGQDSRDLFYSPLLCSRPL